MNVVGYVRSSTEGSVGRQREAITSWATSQKAEVTEWIEDAAELVRVADDGSLSAVIVCSACRLARDMAELESILRLLRQRGISVVFLDGGEPEEMWN